MADNDELSSSSAAFSPPPSLRPAADAGAQRPLSSAFSEQQQQQQQNLRNSMTSRPWQYDWKRPVWQKATANANATPTAAAAATTKEAETSHDWLNEDDYCLAGHTAAAVLPQELPLEIMTTMMDSLDGNHQDKKNTATAMPTTAASENATDTWERTTASLVLTVTLIAKKECCESPSSSSDASSRAMPVADIVLVELLRQESYHDGGAATKKDLFGSKGNEGCAGGAHANSDHNNRKDDADTHLTCLKSRILRWPESANVSFSTPLSSDLDDQEECYNDSDEEEEEKGDNEINCRSRLFSFLSFCRPVSTRTTSGSKNNKLLLIRKNPKSRQQRAPRPWLEPRPRGTTTELPSGLVSAALCRLPRERENTAAQMADALDMVQLISLTGVAAQEQPLSQSSTSGSNIFEEKNNSKNEPLMNSSDNAPKGASSGSNATASTATETTDLVLACVTHDGRVHFYSPLQFLEHETKTNKNNDRHPDCWGEQGMAALLFGDDALLNSVQDSILPLSEPIQSLTLSLPLRQQQRQKDNNKKNQCAANDSSSVPPNKASYTDMPAKPSSISSSFRPPHSHPRKKDTSVSAWDFSLWDSTQDRASLCYQTKDNRLTLCCAAMDFLCVAGRGTKKDEQEWRLQQEVNHSGSPDPQKDENPQHQVPGLNQAQDVSNGHEVDDGGFVTFISLYNYSEVRTVYLPFAPSKLQPFVWGNMAFLLVQGETTARTSTTAVGHAAARAVAIRINASDLIGFKSGESLPHSPSPIVGLNNKNTGLMDIVRASGDSEISLAATATTPTSESKEKIAEVRIRRFQLLPVVLSGVAIPDLMSTQTTATTTAVGSSTFTSPPGLVSIIITGKKQESPKVSVAQHTMRAIQLAPSAKVDPIFSRYSPTCAQDGSAVLAYIETKHVMGHVAHIAMPSNRSEDRVDKRTAVTKRPKKRKCNTSSWCHLGQGWCLLGTAANKHVYFICWEGARATRGAFWCELSFEDKQNLGSHSELLSVGAPVLPVDPFTRIASSRKQILEEEWPLPPPFAAGQYNSATQTANFGGDTLNRVSSTVTTKSDLLLWNDQKMDAAIVEAIEKISNACYEETVARRSPIQSPRRRSTSFTHREKSAKLLSLCSSWTKSHKSNIQLGSQEPLVSLRRLGNVDEPSTGHHFFLSLRRAVVENGAASPFPQVLSWLLEKRDYFTAASLALDLLRDADSLRHLWKAFAIIDDEGEISKLEGLLDGIVPIQYDCAEHDDKAALDIARTLSKVADMTVECLIKGGFAMSSTLEQFLVRDRRYDPSKASLMLAAMAAGSLSDDVDDVTYIMGPGYKIEDYDSHEHLSNILWPVRCILKIGVAHNKLETVVSLLNATIPDELRQRRRGSVPTVSLPSMEMCKSLVSLIVASSPGAADLLLSLADDDHLRTPFWSSLEHETRLELALVDINGKSPLLREPEVRSWVLQQLQELMEAKGMTAGATMALPTDWLKALTMACLLNAGCQLDVLFESNLHVSQLYEHGSADDSDELQEHAEEARWTRNALMPSPGSGGLDFDLIVPALLLLEQRRACLRDDSNTSTQSLLNSACYLAGRRINSEEPIFALDISTLMRQCTLVGNIQAGANLIGGKNGFILECCSILIEFIGIGMEEAEVFLTSEPMLISATIRSKRDDNTGEAQPFCLDYGHRHILWLLEEHVLRIRTYGEFDTTNCRGKVDPCLAATVCIRTWWCITRRHQLAAGTDWLVKWLRKQLAIFPSSHVSVASVSPHRLVCAALTRALIWPSDSGKANPESTLGALLGMPSEFLMQLAQSCCGLVESLPNFEVLDVWSKMINNNRDFGSPTGSLRSPGRIGNSPPPKYLQLDV